MHTNKIAIFISSKLIQKNTYEKYVSCKDEDLYTIIENNDEYLLFFTHVCKYLQNLNSLIPHTNIKQFSNSLSQVILKVVKHNLVQVLPQFRGIHKRPCRFCYSSEHFNNQCKNKTSH
jgi:hypothetical protein